MLKFILLHWFRFDLIILISKHLMLKFIFKISLSSQQKWDFKTSYVEVYPFCSATDSSRRHLFQNILCWSLSRRQRAVQRCGYNFKTSYVEVYHQLSYTPVGCLLYFKTSYVEVYPTFSRYFYLLLSIFPFIFPDFYHFYQASAHILFPIQYLTNSPTLQYFLNIFLFFAW